MDVTLTLNSGFGSVVLSPAASIVRQRRRNVDSHGVAGPIPFGIELERCEIPVSKEHGVFLVSGAVYAYKQNEGSDKDVWDVMGAHRIANRLVLVERQGEIIDDAAVAESWSSPSDRKKLVPSDRISVTVSAEWLAVADGDHKTTFSGRMPTKPLDGWRM